jgi:hypothetical protein
LVGVATDLARKLRAEKLIEKYRSDSIFKLWIWALVIS